MKRFNIRMLLISSVIGLAVLGFACGGDDDGDEPTALASAAATQPAATQPANPTTAPTSAVTAGATEEAPTATSNTPAAGGSTVQAGAAGLVDAEGFSLYTYSGDTADSGISACVGGCATAWPPLVVDGTPTAGPGVNGELGTVTRTDGSTQVTYKGLPLYHWQGDEAPGDTNGAAIQNWTLAQP